MQKNPGPAGSISSSSTKPLKSIKSTILRNLEVCVSVCVCVLVAVSMQRGAAVSTPRSVCEALVDAHRSKAQCACRRDTYGLGSNVVGFCHKTIEFTFSLSFAFWSSLSFTGI